MNQNKSNQPKTYPTQPKLNKNPPQPKQTQSKLHLCSL